MSILQKLEAKVLLAQSHVLLLKALQLDPQIGPVRESLPADFNKDAVIAALPEGFELSEEQWALLVRVRRERDEMLGPEEVLAILKENPSAQT